MNGFAGAKKKREYEAHTDIHNHTSPITVNLKRVYKQTHTTFEPLPSDYHVAFSKRLCVCISFIDIFREY